MALDHFVSQVHLKNFYSPDLHGQLYAIRKSDLKVFFPHAEDVCRIEEGSTNNYLREPRAIEDFLKKIEPNYNKSMEMLIRGNVDQECIFTVAGFAAYIITCSPAAMRLQAANLGSMVGVQMDWMDHNGELPPLPPGVDRRKFHQGARKGVVEVVVDHKYPQAIGISNIHHFTSTFGNSSWDVIINDHKDNSFFTSDYPITMETSRDPRIRNRIVPLSPNLAVRFQPRWESRRANFDFTFQGFNHRIIHPGLEEISRLNRKIVRAAETTVFFRDRLPWIDAFVAKNHRYRTELCKRYGIVDGRMALLTSIDVVQGNF